MNAELHTGDCLTIVRDLRSASVDLVYLDPPFFTQKRHRLAPRSRDREFAFDDSWASSSEYGNFLRERVQQLHRVLKPDGSIFFHCDRSGGHIARAVLDSVFGEDMFRSEIVWTYRRWSNSQRGLLPQHQTILWYSRTDDYAFNPAYEAYSPSTNIDQLLAQRERDEHGKAVYARDAAGAIVPSKSKRGVPLGDVWDIPYLNPKAAERVGYPTQKPVALLERILALTTSPGALVLDPFCGSGTTLVAAALQGRRAIGIDISADAIGLTRQRLAQPSKTHSKLLAIGRQAYEQVDERALGLLHGLAAIPVQRNKGIDALLPCGVNETNALVRVQRDDEPLAVAIAALQRAAEGKYARLLVIVAVRPIPPGFCAPAGCLVVPAPSAVLAEALAAPITPAGHPEPAQLTLRPRRAG